MKSLCKKVPIYVWVLLLVLSVGTSIIFFDVKETRTHLAKYFFGNGHPDIALALYPHDAELLESIGHYYMGVGEYDTQKATEAYERALAQSSTTLWAEYQLGRIAFVQGNFTEAHRRFEHALIQNPYNKRIVYARGVLYAYEKNWSLAANDFNEFIAWAPTEWGAYNDLAWVLAEQQKFDESEHIAQKGIDTAKDGNTNPWLWNALGVAQYNRNLFDKAKISFEKAKQYSVLLSTQEWVQAYSANDPAHAESALINFKKNIDENRLKSIMKSGG